MRLDDLDPSSNVNDQGSGGGGFGGGGGGVFGLLFGLLPMLLGRKMGCGTIAIIAVVGYFVMSSGMLNLGGSGVAPETVWCLAEENVGSVAVGSLQPGETWFRSAADLRLRVAVACVGESAAPV